MNKNNNTKRIGAVGVIVGLLNGVFGSGGGTVAVPAMQRYLNVDTHKSHATAISVILPLSCVSLIVYMRNGMPDLTMIICISIGGLVGGFIGAKLLNRIKSSWLHKIFGLFMIVASFRMIF